MWKYCIYILHIRICYFLPCLTLKHCGKSFYYRQKLLYKNKTNVSTKFLDKYISFYVFLHNWSVDKGKYPSSFKDAEEILIHILSVVPNSSFTLEDFRNTKLTLPKPTT